MTLRDFVWYLHKRILQYKVEEYGYYGIYEISLQQDKATDS